MENKKLYVFVALFLGVFGVALGDYCVDDDVEFCDNCCGDIGYQWCCDDYYWSTGSIAGASIGIFIFIFITVVVIVLCRRRRVYGYYWSRPAVMTVANPTHISTVSSTTVATGAAYPPPYGVQY